MFRTDGKFLLLYKGVRHLMTLFQFGSAPSVDNSEGFSKNSRRVPSPVLISGNLILPQCISDAVLEAKRTSYNWKMKIRGGKFAGGNWKSLELPSIFLLCLFFFIAGFFGSSLFFQQEMLNNVSPAIAEKVELKGTDFEPQPHGVSGEDSLQTIPFQILSWKPRALYFPNFATAEQCQSIIQTAQSRLRPSSLALRKGETAENTKGIRTSSGMFISSSEDKAGVLAQIEAKIAKASMIQKSHGESFNVLRYQTGQSYHCHYDSFNPTEYGPQKSQRVASFLLYLSDVEEGGETVFPFEDGRNMGGNYDYQQCIGLKVKPRRGDGLLFYSLFANGTIDPTSLHGSCPVIKGEKWVATKWIRDRMFNAH